VRRRLTTLALTLSVLALSILPALAADGGTGDVQGANPQINGILFALILGTIVGVGLFLDAYARDADQGGHHGDEAGH